MELKGDEIVLDVGAGTGRLGMKIAPRCRSVTLVDESPRMLRRAKPMPNLKTIVGNIHKVTLPDRHFDLVVVSDVIHHLQRPHTLFSLLWKTLKDQGRLLILDYSPSSWTTRLLARFEHRLFGKLQFFSLQEMERSMIPWFQIEKTFTEKSLYLIMGRKTDG